MKKIFKMFIYKIETKVCNMINNLACKLDRQYTNVKFENEIAARKLVVELKHHIVDTHTVINMLEEHIQKLNRIK